MKWIEWIEPFGPSNEPVYCRVKEATAIATQRAILKKARGIEYVSDRDALMDFIVVHWAKVIDA